MATTKPIPPVVGIFEDRTQADKAVNELMKAGFRKDQIGVAMRHDEEKKTGRHAKAADTDETYAGTGAVTGVLTGLGLGAIAGLGVLAGVVPVIGPAITAGTLGIVLSNAAAGAGIVGVLGALIGAGVPEEEAKYYHEEFEAGRTIVTVTTPDRTEEARTIMRDYGAYDISNRAAAYTASPTTTTRSNGHAKRATARHANETIEVKEERLHAKKRPVETGAVKVRKEVHTENKTIDVPVEHEEVVIERTAGHGRTAKRGIANDMHDGEEIRIPVSEERVTVTKEPVVVEEVKVGKRTIRENKQVSGQVRKEKVKVEQTGNVKVENRTTARSTKRV